MSGIVKPVLSPSDVSSLPHCHCPDFASRHRATAAYWWASVWPDGTKKKVARLSFWVTQQGVLQVQFQLTGTGLMVRLDLPDPLLVWDALEGVLGQVPVPWQVDPFLPADEPHEGKKGRKKGS